MRMKLNVSKRTSDHPARSREVLERMKALQDKSYATEVAMGLAQQEAEKRVQAAERETFSVRKELEDRIFGDIPATVDAMLTPTTKARMVDTNHVHEGVQTKSTNEIATDVGT
mmetsp:Transcript_83706/g.236299  ORF Transcript_83706/g.236299 Transcript_83706/m.236299 type:complete len:113 (+) Transcript_83706:1866-2204(+)